MPVPLAPAALLRPPSGDEIAAVGQAVLDGLPAAIRDLVRHVPIVVQDWPDEETLDAVSKAKAFVTEAVRGALAIGEGIGPVNPLGEVWARRRG